MAEIYRAMFLAVWNSCEVAYPFHRKREKYFLLFAMKWYRRGELDLDPSKKQVLIKRHFGW